MLHKCFFSIKSIYYISIEYIKYKFCKKDKLLCLSDIANNLININILYTKLFQSIANNSHIFNKQEINSLIIYTDNVPYTNEDIDDYFEDNYLKNNNIINIINKEPIKSGVIALIYEGYIDGKKIIIKVKRKNIDYRLNIAYDNILFLFKLLNNLTFFKQLAIYKTFKNNKEQFLSQLDMKNEIKNNKIFQEKFKNIDYIIIPKIYENLCNYNNIIIMEYINGYNLEYIKEMYNTNRLEYIQLFIKFFIKGLLFDRYIHGDLHSGNIIFQNNNNNKSIAIIDYGIIYELTKEEQYIWFKYAKAIKEKSYTDMVDIFFQYIIKPEHIIKNLPQYKYNELYNIIYNFVNEMIINNEPFVSQRTITLLNNYLFNYNLYVHEDFNKIQLSLALAINTTNELKPNDTVLINMFFDVFDDSSFDFII